jgi:hypothetical protein
MRLDAQRSRTGEEGQKTGHGDVVAGHVTSIFSLALSMSAKKQGLLLGVIAVVKAEAYALLTRGRRNISARASQEENAEEEIVTRPTGSRSTTTMTANVDRCHARPVRQR